MPEGGGPGRKAQVSDEEILDSLNSGTARTGAPALPTSDVADLLPISRQAVKRRLENLAEEGEVGVHQAGRNRFWWVADEEYSGGKVVLDEVVEAGDLTDERLINLFREQISPQQLPESFSSQIIQETLSPDDIPDGVLHDKLRNEVKYSDLPEDIASDIAYESFGFNSSYWARRVREGVLALASAMILFIAAFILLDISSDPPTLLTATLGRELVIALIEGLTILIALAWIGALSAGALLILVGALSRMFMDGEKPPWEGYYTSVQKRLK